MNKYRKLTDLEITELKANGCRATDWSLVRVADHALDTSLINNVEFSGNVRIGRLEGEFTRLGGLVRRSSLSNVTLHETTVGDGVYINHVANYIANYDIADGVYIENINSLVSTTTSTYGIGTEVSVLIETGGREVPIYERLSAQIAYLIAMHRHNKAMVDNLFTLINARAESFIGKRGTIGENVEITNCGTITDVNIGAYAKLRGATRLKNGTIAGSEHDPVFVGRDVIAEGFIFASGSSVNDGAVLHHCFVGQSSELSHLFSGHDSLFFSNCVCENGEAAAIFGGPYTVTMHKSSLLIAGIFSFLNAGSGSNQSNHMYKLGPIHQGVVERGSKTTSDSYILWPARIGAFSLVMGRHVNHPDTSRLPFSYLIESINGSYLVPGVNLQSVGTIRDAQKWPRRDKRKDPDRLDCINFNLLSPYTVGSMMEGIDLLDNIERTAGYTAERYSYQSMTIEARALRRGKKYYAGAIDKFMGNSIIHRLGDDAIMNDNELRERLKPTHPAGKGRWIDVCGLIAPKDEIDRISQEIADGTLNSLDEIEQRFKQLHSDYYEMEWTWVCDNLSRWYGKDIEKLSMADIRSIVDRWLNSVISIDNKLLEDAAKEYSSRSRTGFGIDGRECDSNSDFENVRGDFDNDPFVIMVREHICQKTALGEKALSLLDTELSNPRLN